MHIPSILRQDHSRTFHIGISAIVGAAAGALVGVAAGWRYTPAAGCNATATFYMIWMRTSLGNMTPSEIESIVQQRRPAGRPADTIIIIASIASLGSVAYLLVAGTAKGPDATIAAVIGFLSVIASWLVVQAVYTLRYAILFYTAPAAGSIPITKRCRPFPTSLTWHSPSP